MSDASAARPGRPPDGGQTPAAQGFFLPAEWGPHERTLLGWPSRVSAYGSTARLQAARAAHAAVARALAPYEKVTVLAPQAEAIRAQRLLGPGIEITTMALDDCWLRDTGPTWVIDGQGGRAGIAWRFNAWGEKFHPYDQDATLAGRILRARRERTFEAGFVLEGGAIGGDGAGTLLTTQSCALNPNRNAGMDQPRFERLMAQHLGARQVIWLQGGLQADADTDGHVDTVACFARPGLVLAQTCDRGHRDHAVLAENIRRLRAATDAEGRRLEVVEIEGPADRVAEGRRLPLSYINFAFAGSPGRRGAAIVPVFDDPADAPAIATLAALFPERDIVPVPALDIFAGGGGIHCITQPVPAANPA
ncbi:MAG: agmatine/peptidylarginine deiminase [Reyranellaceae bacterium]